MEMKSKQAGSARKVVTGLVVVLLVLAVVYIAGGIYFKTHFLIGTTINGVDCSMTNVAGAESRIAKVVQNFEITVKERQEQTESINGSTYDMDVVFDDSMNTIIAGQNAWNWPFSLKTKEKDVGVTVTYDEDKLRTEVLALDALQQKNNQPPVDAKLSYNEDTKQYEVVAEDVGTTLNTQSVLTAVKTAVEELCDTVDLESEGCYVNPTYVSDSEAVTTALEKLNKYVACEVTYDYETDKVTVDSDQIAQWLNISDDFKVTFDKDKVQSFVSEMASTYDTIFTTRKFQTSYGQEITITQGDYGWWTDRISERKDLIRFIKEGKSGTKEPVYYQKGMQRGDDDIGDSYAEVNLTRQHVLLYKDGELVAESDCVTGKDKTPTPSGVYSVTYLDHTYEGHQVQLVGEDYSSDVDYFIPFNGNVGFHDASWRKGVFGGSIYHLKGSHGCINLPYSMAETIYNTMEVGMPVIVYNESD
jgi:hypothetical protein